MLLPPPRVSTVHRATVKDIDACGCPRRDIPYPPIDCTRSCCGRAQVEGMSKATETGCLRAGARYRVKVEENAEWHPSVKN